MSLLQDLQVRALHLQVLRVPTALNLVADALSQVDPLNTEWTLPTLAFEDVLRWAGPLEVDLMASPVNHRLPKWVSAFPHPGALAVDCRSFDWAAFGSLYLFPPTAMIPLLLHLILACPVTLMVIVLFSATRDVVSLSVSEGAGSPAPPHDPAPAHRGGDRLARVGHLRTLDRSAFLRQVLSARYPPRVIDTLLAAFRPSSQRQHDLAWRLFQRWLPNHIVSLSRVQVLEFLQHLFDEVGLSPRTMLCYRAALQWPLQEAFGIDFGHDDFRCQATGLFHLRPPSAAPLPQWDLNEILRFYDSVDVSSCPLRLAFLKALFLTALASGNRCAELAHFSRRATVDTGSSLTFGLKPRFLYKNQASGRLRYPCLFSVTTLRSAQWSRIGRIWPVRRRYLTTILCLYTPLCRRPWWRAGSTTGWCKPSQPRRFVGRLSVPMMSASSPSVWTGPAARTSNTSCRTGFGLQHTRFWAITSRHVRPFFRPLLRLVCWSNTSSCPGDLFSDWLLESSFVYIL